MSLLSGFLRNRRFIGLHIVLSTAACGPDLERDAPRQHVLGETRASLSPGWHLWGVGPFGGREVLSSLPADCCSLFRVEQVYDAAENRVVQRSRLVSFSEVMADDGIYWVHIRPEGDSRALSLPPPTLATNSEGVVFQAATRVRAGDVGVGPVSRWEGDGLAPLSSDEALEPGLAYWIESSDGCGAPLWAASVDGHPPRGCTGARAPESFVASESSLPPQAIYGWHVGQDVHLRWSPPSGFSDGQPLPVGVTPTYRVYRHDGFSVDLVGTTYRDRVPELGLSYRYHVTAVLEGEDGGEHESGPSDRLEIAAGFAAAVPRPGDFESAAEVTPRTRSASLPALAFSRVAGEVWTHLGYLVPGKGHAPDQIRVAHSRAYAKKGSWREATAPLVVAPTAYWITDFSLTAHMGQVVVGWIETANDGSGSRIRVLILSDVDAVVRAQHPTVEREMTFEEGAGLKADLDMAFDRLGHHHLIWSESGKVYYLKNFEARRDGNGNLWNVFDEEKRRINQELVKYTRAVPAKCSDGSECCTETKEIVYSLGMEPKPGSHCLAEKNCDENYGPYLERIEETYVEGPSLFVGRESITIVARQTRMFDNLVRPNPAWVGLGEAAWGPSVPPPRWESCGARGSLWSFAGTKRFRKGFLHARLRDQYACALPIPVDRPERLKKEEQFAHVQDFGVDRDRYYTYDGRQGHPQDWYQYTHAGLWHEDDKIKVAQRPLEENAWHRPERALRRVPRLVRGPGARVVVEEIEQEVERGFRWGAWRPEDVIGHGDRHAEEGYITMSTPPPMTEGAEALAARNEKGNVEETRLRWRISTVARFPCERAGEIKRCGTKPSPDLGPVGPSYAKVSQDLSDPQKMFLVYEKGPSKSPHDPANNSIYLARSSDGGLTWSHGAHPVAKGYMPALSLAREGDMALVYYAPDTTHSTPSGVPLGQIMVARSHDQGTSFTHDVLNGGFDEFSGQEQLYPAQPIHWTTYGAGQDRYDGVPALAAHEDLWVVAFVRHAEEAGQRNQIMTTRASLPKREVKHTVVAGPAQVTQNQSFKAEVACVNQYRMLAMGCELEGAALAYSSGGLMPLGASLIPDGRLNGQTELWLPGVSGLGTPEEVVHLSLTSPKGVLDQSPLLVGLGEGQGNYYKAKLLRDRLFSDTRSLQREYDDHDAESQDAEFLSSYDRVWAYTQGIALAQLAKEGDPRSTSLAKRLCGNDVAVREAKHGGGQVIKGWHFSWNTHDDTWKDVRLVTGAGAWVVHGLGVYLSSEEAQSLSLLDRVSLQTCYLEGLEGLFQHRSGALAQDPLARWLMTAGVTREGLKYAERMEELDLTDARLGLEDDRPEPRSWAYYDILDVLGYDVLNYDLKPKITTFYRDENQERTFLQDVHLGPEHKWVLEVLGKEARAENVVTEHNLDTLSVLNHAIQHWDEMLEGLPSGDLTGRIQPQNLVEWRDHLRTAIFELLWDEAEGRVVTGGEFDDKGAFHPASLTAIDNCSWLALSVNYAALNEEERTKLARCLDYTVRRFTREKLTHAGGEYYGAFYFPNSFKDPYVPKSNQQEDLYHLEATAGLILGLLRFFEAHPDPSAAEARALRGHAARLWSDMQRFVHDGGDHGFPYSTIRIQDVMARLPSATAAIWYIDVYDHFASQVWHLDRPLDPYVHEAGDVDRSYPLSTVRAQTEALWEVFNPVDEGARDLSGGLVGASETGLSSSTTTYLEDQALAIVAAVNYGKRDAASSWVKGLLRALIRSDDGARVEVPYGVVSTTAQPAAPYVQTHTQLLAAYALGWFAKDEPDVSRRDTLIEAMRAILDSTVRHYQNAQGLFVSGSGEPPPSPWPSDADEGLAALSPVFSVATIEDHVMAYFAFGLAAKLDGSGPWAERANDMGDILQAWFWGSQGTDDKGGTSDLPVRRLLMDGVPQGPEGVFEASVFYLLFAAEHGEVGRATRALDLLSGLRPAVDSSSVGDQGFFNGVALTILGKRAGAELDPRLEEIAWNDYHATLGAATRDGTRLRPGFVAGMLITQNPCGFLGVEAEPLVGIGPLKPTTDPVQQDEVVLGMYTQAVSSILAEGIRPYSFDAHIRRLAAIDFVTEAVQEAWPLTEWLGRFQKDKKQRVRRVVADLGDFCDARVSGVASSDLTGHAMASRLGQSCEAVSTTFAEALVRRVGTRSPEDLIAVLTHPNDAFELLTLVGDVFYVDEFSLEPVRASSNVAFVLSHGQRSHNVRQLLRLINLKAGGNLPKVAHQADLTVDEIQRMIRTGQLREEDFDRLARGLLLGADDRGHWSSQFHFVEPGNWPWPSTPSRSGEVLVDVHRDHLSKGVRTDGPLGADAAYVADGGTCQAPTSVSVASAETRIAEGSHQLVFREGDGCQEADWGLMPVEQLSSEDWSVVHYGGLQILSFAERTRRLSKLVPLLTKPTDDWVAAMTAAGAIVAAELVLSPEGAVLDPKALRWNRLRLFQRAPANDDRWRFLGLMYGLDGLLATEMDFFKNPIWMPSEGDRWRPTGTLNETSIYAVVQPKEFQEVPLLDPTLPIFPLAAIEHESEHAWLAIYERIAPVPVLQESAVSPQTSAPKGLNPPGDIAGESPLVEAYPEWITKLFPPELWWSAYYTNFIEPGLNGGEAARDGRRDGFTAAKNPPSDPSPPPAPSPDTTASQPNGDQQGRIAPPSDRFWSPAWIGSYESPPGQEKSGVHPPIIVLPLHQRDAYLPVLVPLTIGGKTLFFALDTGSAVSLIQPAALEKLNGRDYTEIDWGEKISFRDGSSVEPTALQLKEVHVGARSYPALPMVLAEIPAAVADKKTAPDGILGADFFSQHVVDINFGAQTVHIYPKGAVDRKDINLDASSSIPFALHNSAMWTRARFQDGDYFPAMLDLGASVSLVSAAAAATSAGGDQRSLKEVDGFSPLARQETVWVGDVSLDPKSILIGKFLDQESIWANETGWMRLGLSSLVDNKRLVVDFGSRKVYVSDLTSTLSMGVHVPEALAKRFRQRIGEHGGFHRDAISMDFSKALTLYIERSKQSPLVPGPKIEGPTVNLVVKISYDLDQAFRAQISPDGQLVKGQLSQHVTDALELWLLEGAPEETSVPKAPGPRAASKQLSAAIPKDLDAVFRTEVVRLKGSLKGAFSEAAAEAVAIYVKKSKEGNLALGPHSDIENEDKVERNFVLPVELDTEFREHVFQNGGLHRSALSQEFVAAIQLWVDEARHRTSPDKEAAAPSEKTSAEQFNVLIPIDLNTKLRDYSLRLKGERKSALKEAVAEAMTHYIQKTEEKVLWEPDKKLKWVPKKGTEDSKVQLNVGLPSGLVNAFKRAAFANEGLHRDSTMNAFQVAIQHWIDKAEQTLPD